MSEAQMDRLSSYQHGNHEPTPVCELIEHRVPMHVGGMCDPFTAGDDRRVTLELIRRFPAYPMMFSTKTAELGTEYLDIMVPDFHVFQISISGFPDDTVRDFERATPTTRERVLFAKKLKAAGFRVFIRIQPLVRVEWAEDVIRELGDVVDGFTIEHLKLPKDNVERFELLRVVLMKHDIFGRLYSDGGREWVFHTEDKKKNIERLKAIKRTALVYVGDNDLRLMSEGVNCCGLNECGKEFENWIRFNSMTMKMTGDRDVWRPSVSPKKRGDMAHGINGDCVKPSWKFEDYVVKDFNKTYGNPDQMELFTT